MTQTSYKLHGALVGARSTSSGSFGFCCKNRYEGSFNTSGRGLYLRSEKSYLLLPLHPGNRDNRLSMKVGHSQFQRYMSTPRRCVASQSERIPADMLVELQPDTQTGDDFTATAAGSRRNVEMQTEVTKKIRQLAKSGNLAQALAVMENLQAAGVQPDAIAATALVDCCVRCKNLPEAERVFDTLFESTGVLRPDGIAIAVLVRGFGAASPPQWIKIQRLLARLENDFFTKLTTSVYNELLDICVRTNDMDKGTELLDKMHAKEISPDVYTIDVIKRKRILRSHLKKVFADRF